MKWKTRCPRCSRPTRKDCLLTWGVCGSCRFDRERDLVGAEREMAIQRHMTWLGGLMPSQAIERDRQKAELEIMRFAVRSKWGRTRPGAN